MNCPGCGALDDHGCYVGCPETMPKRTAVSASEANYPAEALRTAYERGYKAGMRAGIKRMEDFIDGCLV